MREAEVPTGTIVVQVGDLIGRSSEAAGPVWAEASVEIAADDPDLATQ